MIENIKDMTTDEVSVALCKYIDYSSVFGPAQAMLAGMIANDESMGLDRMIVAKSVFLGALDEFMDSEHGGVTHRELAERMRAALGSDAKCDPFFKSEGVNGYSRGGGFSLGWHYAVEEMADIEYNLIDRLLRDYHPKLVKHLKANNAYDWIERHTVADAHHLEYARAGLKYVPTRFNHDIERGISMMYALEVEALADIFAIWTI